MMSDVSVEVEQLIEDTTKTWAYHARTTSPITARGKVSVRQGRRILHHIEENTTVTVVLNPTYIRIIPAKASHDPEPASVLVCQGTKPVRCEVLSVNYGVTLYRTPKSLFEQAEYRFRHNAKPSSIIPLLMDALLIVAETYGVVQVEKAWMKVEKLGRLALSPGTESEGLTATRLGIELSRELIWRKENE